MSRRRCNALYWYALLIQASEAIIDTFTGMRAAKYVKFRTKSFSFNIEIELVAPL